MKRTSLALAAVLAATVTLAADPTPETQKLRIPPIYIPFAAYYMNGAFLKVVPVGEEWFQTLRECTDAMQHAVLTVQENGKVPAGGSMKATCVPVPAMDTPR